MTRNEWLTLVILGGLADFILILILVYLRFIWDLNCKQWDVFCHGLTTTKLRMGDQESRERGMGPGVVYREGRTPLPTRSEDAS